MNAVQSVIMINSSIPQIVISDSGAEDTLDFSNSDNSQYIGIF